MSETKRLFLVGITIGLVLLVNELRSEQYWIKWMVFIAYISLYAIDQLLEICGRLRWIPRNWNSSGFYALCFDRAGPLWGWLPATAGILSAYTATFIILRSVLPSDEHILRPLIVALFVVAFGVLFPANMILMRRGNKETPQA